MIDYSIRCYLYPIKEKRIRDDWHVCMAVSEEALTRHLDEMLYSVRNAYIGPDNQEYYPPKPFLEVSNDKLFISMDEARMLETTRAAQEASIFGGPGMREQLKNPPEPYTGKPENFKP